MATRLTSSTVFLISALLGSMVTAPVRADETKTGALVPSQQALLGDQLADTVFTPLPNGKCQVAVSAAIGSPTVAGVIRDIDTEDTPSYAFQGGTGSSAGDGSINCGIPSFVTAVLVNVRAMSTGPAGDFRIFEGGTDYRSGSVISVPAGGTVTADTIVKSCQSCSYELQIRTTTPMNYVINVVGYFMRPQATALDCTEMASAVTTVAANGGIANVFAPACPAGYTETGTNCNGTSWYTSFPYFAHGTCSARNNGATSTDVTAYRTCCRVPGR